MNDNMTEQNKKNISANVDVIEADVVAEFVAKPQANSENMNRDSSSSHEKALLIAFIGILLGSTVLLHDQTKAIPAASFSEQPELQLPVIVRYQPVSNNTVVTNISSTSFSEIVNDAEKLQRSAERLSRPNMPSNRVLNQPDYNALRGYLLTKEGIRDEGDVRDVLLQAGYTLPSLSPDESQANKRSAKNGQNHLDFARSVVGKLLKDEVESFLNKVRVASEVGVYVSENAAE